MVTGKPMLSAEQIRIRVSELGSMISSDYEGREILAIGILKGSFMFYADLVRCIKVPITNDFIIASSYVKTSSSGKLDIFYDVREEIKGKHVLLIDDIIDSGLSLNCIRDKILQANPESLKICCFLDKKACRKVDVPVDYVGFEIPDAFIVGYGLDYENQFRNLPYITIFRRKT
jgi:hypoxanthine phosphoribosyltransferase